MVMMGMIAMLVRRRGSLRRRRIQPRRFRVQIGRSVASISEINTDCRDLHTVKSIPEVMARARLDLVRQGRGSRVLGPAGRRSRRWRA